MSAASGGDAMVAYFFFRVAFFLAAFLAAFLRVAFFLATSRPPNHELGDLPTEDQAGAEPRGPHRRRNKTTNFSTSWHRHVTRRNKSPFVSSGGVVTPYYDFNQQSITQCSSLL